MPKYYFNQKETDEYLANLPKKSIAVKVIIRSNKGSILLVKPNYKPTWQFPGGGVEQGEEPKTAAIRELNEELGLQITRGSLRLIDTVFRKDYDNLILLYKYIPAVLETIKLRVQEDELEGYKFERPDRIAGQLGEYYRDFLRDLVRRTKLG